MDQGMEDWIYRQPMIKKENDLLYLFIYKDNPCAGIVTVCGREYILNIRPCNIKHDIGEGAGCQVTKVFKKK